MRYIDSFLNAITMYRLVLYGLVVLVSVSIIFGFLGLLPFSGVAMLFTLTVLTAVGYLTHRIFAWIFKATTNSESYRITVLILFLIVPPISDATDFAVTAAVAFVAMASKYLLAIEKKHIFNPAAFGVFLLGLFGFGTAIWWVGSLILLPFVAVLGFLIVRKIRKPYLVLPFFLTAILTISLFNLRNGLSITESITQVVTSWPTVFFATVMLTEPLTAPTRFRLYVLYSGLVGILFGLQFHIGPLFVSPEFALVVGNIFSYIVSPKQKLFLKLKEKKQLSSDIFEFIFTKRADFSFHPGQYLEWTVPPHHVDSRGNRRYFTIASSPTEEDIRLGVKILPKQSSRFKKALLELETGDRIVASQLAGDFILPDATGHYVFIAGGIGVTPFRSMIQYLLDKKEKRDIIFFYVASSPEELVYRDVFDRAVSELGIHVIYVITHPDNVPKGWSGEVGRLNDAILTKHVSDVKERTYYLSGPNVMVDWYKNMLRELGVPASSVITDYFPGF